MSIKKVSPYTLWLALFCLIDPMLYVRNGIMRGNFSIGALVFNFIVGVVLLPLAIVLWFMIKMIYRYFAPGKTITNNMVLIIWGIMFAILYVILR